MLLALRMVQNALRKEVNRLNEENNKLAKEVTLLEQQVQRINEKETELEAITQQQNINSDSFIQLCNTNRITLDELKVTIGLDLRFGCDSVTWKVFFRLTHFLFLEQHRLRYRTI